MKLFPAIDILEGRAVRLLYGKRDKVTDFGDPVECAKRWIDCGAARLHVVNLAGAFGEKSGFHRQLERIAALGVPVQTGGGLRSADEIRRAIRAGAERCVLGTVCAEAPQVLFEAVEEFGERIVVGIDSSGGKLAVRGWTERADKDAFEFGCEARALGVRDAVFTDIGRDGALSGVNLEETVRMAETGLRIIASGGIKDMEDLRALSAQGVYGAVLGRAIYTGAIGLKEAIGELEC